MKNIQAFLIAYVAAAATMLGLDAIWLTLTAHVLYLPVLGDEMLDGFRLGPALAFYALYVCGAVIFAVRPAFALRRWTRALVLGALFGLFAYGTYDLTNQATLKVWSTTITLADMAWGATLTAISSSVGYFAATKLAVAPLKRRD